MNRALLIAASLFAASCATDRPAAATTPTATPSPSRAECCAQCAGAGKRDPAGMDISIKDCRAYAGAEFNGGPGVTEACVAYFATTRTTLGECWKEAPESR
jgi:hypothetical protein